MTCTCSRTTSTHRVNGERHSKTGVPQLSCMFGGYKNPKLHSCSLLFDHATITCRTQGKGHWHAGSWSGGWSCGSCHDHGQTSKLLDVQQDTPSETDTKRQTGHVIGPELAGTCHHPSTGQTADCCTHSQRDSWNPKAPELVITVRRRLREAELRYCRPYFGLVLTDDRRRRRLQWGRNYRDLTINHWSQVLFTNESRFCLSRADGRTRVWRRPGERYSDTAVIQRHRWGGQSVMIQHLLDEYFNIYFP